MVHMEDFAPYIDHTEQQHRVQAHLLKPLGLYYAWNAEEKKTLVLKEIIEVTIPNEISYLSTTINSSVTEIDVHIVNAIFQLKRLPHITPAMYAYIFKGYS